MKVVRKEQTCENCKHAHIGNIGGGKRRLMCGWGELEFIECQLTGMHNYFESKEVAK